ncbi:DUF488 domain-containing protein [Georgenia yuyongxinii]
MLLTVGHGALDRAALTALLGSAQVGGVVDVRRFPGSRANPDVRRDALQDWLPAAGVAYRWEPRLGGRRHLSREARAASPDSWWQVDAFRAYAAWTRDGEFREALTDLLRQAAEVRTAVMCSESVWWRCHRRLIADVAVLAHGTEVHHLMPDGRLRSHVVADGARLAGAGEVVWDA